LIRNLEAFYLIGRLPSESGNGDLFYFDEGMVRPLIGEIKEFIGETYLTSRLSFLKTYEVLIFSSPGGVFCLIL
jgi:hypothetical protein